MGLLKTGRGCSERQWRVALSAAALLAFGFGSTVMSSDIHAVRIGDRPDAIIPLVAPPTDPAKVALGRTLFNDARLSGSGSVSCASCHDLRQGGSDGRVLALGADGRRHEFNTLSVFNAALNFRLNWRGNFRSLEEENEAVLLDPRLMDGSWDAVLRLLRSDPDYGLFASLYGRSWGKDAVLDALAEFQKSLVTPDSRFDRYLKGDKAALTPDEESGYRLFESFGCVSCHQGQNVGGNLYQKFGIFADPFSGRKALTRADLGRFTVTGRDSDRFVFRVPSLRNVALTGPYLHDGSAASLEDAVTTMGRTQLGRELADREVQLLVGFLRTLSGTYLSAPLDSGGEAAK